MSVCDKPTVAFIFRAERDRLRRFVFIHSSFNRRGGWTSRCITAPKFSERVFVVDSVNGLGKMVRSLSQWTKTLSFPSRLSPNRSSKESVGNGQSPGVSPTPSSSSLPPNSEKTVSPIPITEISQIVSTKINRCMFCFE